MRKTPSTLVSVAGLRARRGDKDGHGLRGGRHRQGEQQSESCSLPVAHGRVSGSEAGHELVDESLRCRCGFLTEKAQEISELAEGELDLDRCLSIRRQARLGGFSWVGERARGGPEARGWRSGRAGGGGGGGAARGAE